MASIHPVFGTTLAQRLNQNRVSVMLLLNLIPISAARQKHDVCIGPNSSVPSLMVTNGVLLPCVNRNDAFI